MQQSRLKMFFKCKTLFVGILLLSIPQFFCQETHTSVVSSKISGTDCKAVNDCFRCVHVNNSCGWFISKNECREVDTTTSHEPGDVVVGKNVPGETFKKGYSFCPRVASTKNIYAPSGRHTNISVRIYPGLMSILYSKFSCQVGDGPDAIKKNCVILGNRLHCDSIEFTYLTNEPFVKYPLRVFWGKNEFSNPSNVSVIVYKCHKMADSCASCLSLNRNYKCGWCPASSACEILGQCEETSVDSRWIGRQSLCPEFSQ